MSTISMPLAAVSVRGSRPQRRPVTLTRRGRLLGSLLLLVAAIAAAVLLTGGGAATAGTPAGSPSGSVVPAGRVTVRPGETLWAIAERTAPGVDPRETVAAILDLNALESSSVRAGRVLLLPR